MGCIYFQRSDRVVSCQARLKDNHTFDRPVPGGYLKRIAAKIVDWLSKISCIQFHSLRTNSPDFMLRIVMKVQAGLSFGIKSNFYLILAHVFVR